MIERGLSFTLSVEVHKVKNNHADDKYNNVDTFVGKKVVQIELKQMSCMTPLMFGLSTKN